MAKNSFAAEVTFQALKIASSEWKCFLLMIPLCQVKVTSRQSRIFHALILLIVKK